MVDQLRGKRDRIAAIFAHPDDIELSCGGTLARHALGGDEVIAVVMTSGQAGGDPVEREMEAQAGLAVLGIEHVEFWRQPDGNIPINPELVHRIGCLVSQNHVSKVFTHSPEDSHQDHRAVHNLVIAGTRRMPVSIFLCESPSTRGFHPHMYVDITPTAELKWLAIAQHVSQSMKPWFDMTYFRLHAQYRGRQYSMPLAEAFEIDRLVARSVRRLRRKPRLKLEHSTVLMNEGD